MTCPQTSTRSGLGFLVRSAASSISLLDRSSAGKRWWLVVVAGGGENERYGPGGPVNWQRGN